MIVDASILLAIAFKEKHAEWAKERMIVYRESLAMSTVNLAEALVRIEDRQPHLFEQMKHEIYRMPIRFVSPTVKQAEIAAQARLKFPINFGDCFAYALAKEENETILAIDSDFKKTDAQVELPE